MQVKKSQVRKRMLNSAKAEFLRHGYSNASLRIIAEQAGLSKGAIYAYFENKDALFEALVQPAVSFIENEFSSETLIKRRQEAEGSSFQQTIQGFQRCAFDVLEHHTSFQLLLFCAAGSRFESYKERIIELYAEGLPYMLPYFADRDCAPDVSFNDIFVHTIASVYVGYLEEVVLHEPDRNDIATYAEQMAVFVHAGFKALLMQKNRS